MGKALKTVGMVLGAAAMIATGVGALAMPGLAGSVTLFGVSTGTLNLASAGLTAVGGLLDKPQSAGSGSPSDWTSNPDQPTPFAFGRVGVAGKIIHRDEFGKDNKLQGIVSIFSGAGPIRGFVSYKADDLAVSFESNGGTAIGKYRRQMWRSWRLGAQPDTALSLPTGLDEGAVMPAWDYRYKLSGKACDLLTVQQDSKFSVYPSGVPTPMVELDGIYGYDPRYDDAYPGGAGPCRLGVRSTYVWIDNPIIAGLNWALGMVENGQVVGGIGASIHGIDVPAFVEAANVADANDWKVTAWPDTSEDASQVLRQFLQAGGASYARHAGKISCVTRGAARPSIVTITARDTCGPLELDTGSSSFNRLNTITPEFMSAAHGWQHVPTDPVTFASLRAEDGGKKADRIRYRFAPSAKQAGQLAAYDILDAREPFSGTIPLKPHLRRLKRGDCFTLSEPGFLLDGVKFIVLGRTYDAQKGEVRIAFRSETDGKHDLALGKTATMPEYPGLTPADPTLVSPPDPNDWVITPRPPRPGGTLIPGFDLSGAVGNSTATAIEVQWWEVPDGVDHMEPPPVSADWQSAGVWPPTATNIPIDVPGDRYYWIGLIHVRNLNRSERTVVGPWLAGQLIAGDLTDEARMVITDDIKASIAANLAEFDKSEAVAELVLETILNEHMALEKEGEERTDGIAIAYQAATKYADEKQAEATQTFATIVALGDGMAGTLQQAKSYTDGLRAYSDLIFYTKAESATGLANTLQQAKAYSDDQASAASLLFATKAERANGDATTLQGANAYTDAYKTQAGLTFATISTMNGVSATAGLALSTAVSAEGVAKSTIGLMQDVNGYISGIGSVNDGTTSAVAILSDVFQIVAPGGGAKTQYANGIWWAIDASGTTRSVWGKPFGANGDLSWWTGPNSVPMGAENKSNAFVFISITAPRFGGTDAPSPGGGGDSGYAEGRKLITSTGVVGFSWNTIAIFNPAGVPPSPAIFANVDWGGSQENFGSTWVGEARLVETNTGAVIAGPVGLEFGNMTNEPPTYLQGIGNLSGTVSYSLQLKKSSGGDLSNLTGAVNFTASQSL